VSYEPENERAVTDTRKPSDPQTEGAASHDGFERASSGSPFEKSIGFSRAIRAGDRVLVAGTAPVWPDGHCEDGAYEQARRCFEIISEALTSVGAGLDDVIRTRMYITSPEYAEAVGSVHGDIFGRTRPAATMVVVAALLDARWKVEIEAEALLRGS